MAARSSCWRRWCGSDWGDLVAFDREWASRAYAFTFGHPWWESLAQAATWVASGVVVTALTTAVVLACVVVRRRTVAVVLAITVAGSALANTLVKTGLEQTRPPTARALAPATGFAFPSGHTQAATVTYVAVVLVVGGQIYHPGRLLLRASTTGVTLLVGAVGLSRVLLGAHWSSDVVGGWLRDRRG